MTKPTKAELEHWEEILTGHKPATRRRSRRDPQIPDDFTTDKLPARPVRNGGLLAYRPAERKHRPRVSHASAACGRNFRGTARAKFCSPKCKARLLMRRMRMLRVIRKSSTNSVGRKPTREELKRWDKLLQAEGLGMDRGHQSRRLVYGFRDGISLHSTFVSAVEDELIRKDRKTHVKTCIVCGATFLGRIDAKCCPRPKLCRLKLQRQKK